MNYTSQQAAEESKKILDKLDLVKEEPSAISALSVLGTSYMYPLRMIAIQCSDPAFAEQLNLASAMDAEWQGKTTEMTALRNTFRKDTPGFSDYMDYWLAPLRRYEAWINTL